VIPPCSEERAAVPGVAADVGERAKHWPAAHGFNTARAYRLALEKGARGVAFHLIGEEEVPAREIALAIGDGLGLPTVSKTPEEAAGHFGLLGRLFALDCRLSSMWTRAELGWRPCEAGLVDDLARGVYLRR
jgi:hypothetical protein